MYPHLILDNPNVCLQFFKKSLEAGTRTDHGSPADCSQSDEQVATQLSPSFLPPTPRRLLSEKTQSSSLLAFLGLEHKNVK